MVRGALVQCPHEISNACSRNCPCQSRVSHKTSQVKKLLGDRSSCQAKNWDFSLVQLHIAADHPALNSSFPSTKGNGDNRGIEADQNNIRGLIRPRHPLVPLMHAIYIYIPLFCSFVLLLFFNSPPVFLWRVFLQQEETRSNGNASSLVSHHSYLSPLPTREESDPMFSIIVLKGC
jgi:hypothetical protein